MDNSKASNPLKFLLMPAAFALVFFVNSLVADAIFVSSPTDPINPGDITTSEILDAGIFDVDVSSTSDIHPSKIGRLASGTVLYSAGTRASSSAVGLQFDGYTNTLTVGGPLIASSTTKFNGVTYAWPSADGEADQQLSTNAAGTLAWAAAGGSSINYATATAENITAGQAVRIAVGTEHLGHMNQLTSNTVYFANRSTFQQGRAQSFQASTSILVSSTSIRIRKEGDGSSNLTIEIRTNAAVPTDGTVIATVSIAKASIPISTTTLSAVFDAPVTLAANTSYWLIVRGTTAEVSNYYVIDAQSNGTSYIHGTMLGTDGSASENNANDGWFQIGGLAPAGTLLRTRATTDFANNDYFGIARATAGTSSSLSVAIAGVASGLSGLTNGVGYYLSNTPGALSTSAGTVSTQAGVALTPSELFISRDW